MSFKQDGSQNHGGETQSVSSTPPPNTLPQVSSRASTNIFQNTLQQQPCFPLRLPLRPETPQPASPPSPYKNFRLLWHVGPSPPENYRSPAPHWFPSERGSWGGQGHKSVSQAGSDLAGARAQVGKSPAETVTSRVWKAVPLESS